MSGRLNGKIALITGAGRGIGEAIARAFVREGARIVVAERDATNGQAVAASLAGKDARAIFVACNVADPAAAKTSVTAALTQFGRLDILVNNAGVNVFHTPLETDAEEWRLCFAIDLEGAWHMSKAALPAMLAAAGGSIINIASAHAFQHHPWLLSLSSRETRSARPDARAGRRVCRARRASERDRSGLHRNSNRLGLLEDVS